MSIIDSCDYKELKRPSVCEVSWQGSSSGPDEPTCIENEETGETSETSVFINGGDSKYIWVGSSTTSTPLFLNSYGPEFLEPFTTRSSEEVTIKRGMTEELLTNGGEVFGDYVPLLRRFKIGKWFKVASCASSDSFIKVNPYYIKICGDFAGVLYSFSVAADGSVSAHQLEFEECTITSVSLKDELYLAVVQTDGRSTGTFQLVGGSSQEAVARDYDMPLPPPDDRLGSRYLYDQPPPLPSQHITIPKAPTFNNADPNNFNNNNNNNGKTPTPLDLNNVNPNAFAAFGDPFDFAQQRENYKFK